MSASCSSDRRARLFLAPRRLAALLAIVVVLTGAAWWWYAATRPDYLLKRGQDVLRAGDAEATWQWINALAARGHNDEAALLQGELQFRSRQFAEALATLNQIVDRGELHVQAVFLSGRCLLELRAYVEAERAFLYLHSLRPDEAQTHQGLAAAYYDLGALPQAAAACETWARLEPQAGAPHRFRGIIFNDLTRHAEAVAAFRAALERDLTAEQRQHAAEELASCHVKLNQFAEGLAALAPVIQGPDAGDAALALQAECLRGLGRVDEALSILNRLLDRNLTNVQALRLRALIHLDRDEPQQAAALLETAVRQAPRDRVLRVHLSQAYGVAGNREAAEAQQRKAQEIETTVRALTELTQRLPKDHHNVELHLEMAELYEQLDMNPLAAKCRQVARLLQMSTRP
ncbi:MAG: tetratricopeptide repeat protein [Gemmataceae bacterium]|nr:tetratricopeptide repeat protein [Gemmataceae bacterium]